MQETQNQSAAVIFRDDCPREKAEQFNLTWAAHFAGEDRPISSLLSAASMVPWLDRPALPHKVSLSIARTWMVDNIVPLLPILGALNKLDLAINLRPFGVLQQEILDPASGLYKTRDDYLLLLWNLEDFVPDLHMSWGWDEKQAAKRVQETVDKVVSLLRQAVQRTSSRIICFDFGLDPQMPEKGVLDSSFIRSPGNVRAAINLGVRTKLASPGLSGVNLLNLAAMQYKTGFSRWTDEKLRLTASCPVSVHAQLAIFEEVMRLISLDKRRGRKVLLLDADDTLWGGILEEEGADGVQIGWEYPGNAFAEIQKIILQFYLKGVVLGVCSKNDENAVRELFAKHPGMVLRPEHIAVWAVNWKSKSENIEELASRLNLGLESFVFIDDSPREREEVRQRCPGVLVPDVPEGPWKLLRFWQSFDPFSGTTLSSEDQLRSRHYQDDEKRDYLKKSAVSLEDFYRDLDMRARLWLATEKDIPRIVQMSQRTNQFNATTVRMSENDVKKSIHSAGPKIYLLSLADKFGDSGTVGCMVVACKGRHLVVEQMMLSCRVLKRTVEKHFLGLIMKDFTGKIEDVELLYVPSSRNEMVREFFGEFGKAEHGSEGDRWRVPASDAVVSGLVQPWIN